ncbi:MAG: peptidoglycan DD-metalloendopeptidase family protein [Mailhella sp.]|nr:peptidoglycan DD-metalloendopeptidase family protein [Mailhella sp.]
MTQYDKVLRFAGCCALSVLLTACFGSRPEDGSLLAGNAGEAVLSDVELDIDDELNSAWGNPGAIVDNALLDPDVCEGECLSDRGDIEEDPMQDLSLGSEPMRTGRPVTLGKISVRNSSGMRTASMPKGRIPRPANEKAAMCSGSQTICISSPFGVSRPGHIHKGVDIRAPFGSPIKAFRGGVVTDAKWHHSYGKVVDVQQSDGILARYAHMSQILVKNGERVSQGQVIGRVGSTGRSTGPHLHFELMRDKQHMNPMVQLQAPSHVVSKATENDAVAARSAMSSGRQSQYGYHGRRNAAFNRHLPVRHGRAVAAKRQPDRPHAASAASKGKVKSAPIAAKKTAAKAATAAKVKGSSAKKVAAAVPHKRSEAAPGKNAVKGVATQAKKSAQAAQKKPKENLKKADAGMKGKSQKSAAAKNKKNTTIARR